MDSFVNLAKQGYQAYAESQGSHTNPQSQGSHTQTGEGGGMQDQRYHETQKVPQFDHDEVVDQANEHTGDSGHHSLFSSAMSHITEQHTNEHSQPIDEEHAVRSHKEAYEHGNGSNLDATGMGDAAAMQALKMFTDGKSGSSGSSSQLMSLAMSEAAKLFESSGGPTSGGKQQVINGAAMTMMKMVVQSKLGGGGGGPLGPIIGMAGKFL